MQWLEVDVWERSVNARQGYNNAEKKRMMLSTETLLGLRMTGMYTCVHAVDITFNIALFIQQSRFPYLR